MAARKWVKFEYPGSPDQQVSIAGTFSDWKPKKVTYGNRSGSHVIRLFLAPGKYEYKFVVDGAWVTDPKNPDTIPNDQGTLNSIINVE